MSSAMLHLYSSFPFFRPPILPVKYLPYRLIYHFYYTLPPGAYTSGIFSSSLFSTMISLYFMKYIPLQYALRMADMLVQTNSNDSEGDIDYTNPVSSHTPAA